MLGSFDILIYSMIKKILIFISLIILVGSLWFAWHKFIKKELNVTVTPSDNSQNIPTKQNSEITFDKQKFSLTDPTSLWFVANKHFALPVAYAPNDLIVPKLPLRLASSEQQMHLRSVLETDLLDLYAKSKTAGLQLQLGSGYRSASYQKVLYDGYVSSQGRAEADRSSARPGHSEHQTGLAIDFTRIDGRCHLDSCFGDLPEGKWLAQNAYLYGFILRYTSDKEQVTGYMYEPWHYRYVGKELAYEMHNTGVKTLEEFFALGAAPDYLQ